MITDPNSIVTPEAASVTLDIAEAGSRGLALALDLLIDGALVGVVALALALVRAGPVAYATAIPILEWAYFAFFEGIWQGQTVGKRAMKLRVIRVDGQPARISEILLRNLLRPLDLVAIGPILMLTTRQHQRIGDFVGGTIVVRQPRIPPPFPVPVPPPNPQLPPLDTAAVSEEEATLIREFLQRRWQLDWGPRASLGAQIAASVRQKVQGADAYVWGDEFLLEAVMVSLHDRSARA